MPVKLTLLVDDDNAAFVKSYALRRKTSMSSILNNHLSLLRKIDSYYKKNKPNMHTAKIAGIISSGNKQPMQALFKNRKK